MKPGSNKKCEFKNILANNIRLLFSKIGICKSGSAHLEIDRNLSIATARMVKIYKYKYKYKYKYTKIQSLSAHLEIDRNLSIATARMVKRELVRNI